MGTVERVCLPGTAQRGGTPIRKAAIRGREGPRRVGRKATGRVRTGLTRLRQPLNWRLQKGKIRRESGGYHE